MCDGTSFVPCSIYIKNFDRFFQCHSFNSKCLDIILINEFTLGTWVYQGLCVDCWCFTCSLVLHNCHWDIEKFIIYLTMYSRTSAVNIQGRRDYHWLRKNPFQTVLSFLHLLLLFQTSHLFLWWWGRGSSCWSLVALVFWLCLCFGMDCCFLE